MAKFKVGDIVKDKFGSRLKVKKVLSEDAVVVDPVDPERDGGRRTEPVKYLVAANSCSSTNPVVQNALAAKNSAVAANAGDKKCKVTLETVTFNQGVKPETRHMSIPELRTLLKMLGKGSDAESFIQRLETSGATDIAINDVDLYAALI